MSEALTTQQEPAVLAGFLVYLCVILCVGFITSRLIRSQTDFILGGRKLGPWVIAFSERASGESAWLLIGLPGLALATGFIEIWAAIGCTTGIVVSWIFLARKLRAECDRFNDLTLPDFFMNRFPEATWLLRLSASLLIAFFFTFYIGAQINAAGKVLLQTFPDLMDAIQKFLPYEMTPETVGMTLGSCIIIFYTIMGGFLAVAWTDLIQGIIMIFTLVVLPIAVVMEMQGTGVLSDNLDRLAGDEENSVMLFVTGGKTGLALWLAVLSGLSWGFGYLGQPHLLTRYMAIRSHKDVRMGATIAIFWAVPAFWGAFLIGIVGLLKFGPGLFDDPEKIMPHLTLTVMPTWLAGIMISGAVAAMMSTADSQLLVTSSTISEDIFHKLLRRQASQRTLVIVSRLITLAVGILGFVLAIRSTDLVYFMVAYAWSGLAASFGPPLILTLWWKGTNGFGVLAGMISGALTVILWKTVWFSKLYVSLFFSDEIYNKVLLFIDKEIYEGLHIIVQPEISLWFLATKGGIIPAINPESLMVSHRISGFFVSLGMVIIVSLLFRNKVKQR